MKDTWTKRERFELGRYLNNLQLMLTNWSKDRVSIKPFQESPTPSSDCLIVAVKYFDSNPEIKYDKKNNVYWVARNGTTQEEFNEHFLYLYANLDAFDETKPLDCGMFKSFDHYHSVIRKVNLISITSVLL